MLEDFRANVLKSHFRELSMTVCKNSAQRFQLIAENGYMR